MKALILILILLLPIFKVGNLVYKKGMAGRVIAVHSAHGTHTEPHYNVLWISGQDSGRSQWVYEQDLKKENKQ